MASARIACLLLLGSLVVANAEEPVAIARLEWKAGSLGGSSTRKILLAGKPPPGLALPPAIGKGWFGSVKLGGKHTVAFAIGGGKFWIDTNVDGSLADERPVAGPLPGKAWRHNPTITVGAMPVVLGFHRTATCSDDHVHFSPLIHRRGEVVLGGRLRAVAVSDGDSDLRFDGVKDGIYLDLDGDGRVSVNSDRIEAGKPFAAGGGTFVATVPNADGSVVEFRRSTAKVKPIVRGWTPLRLTAYTRAKADGKGASFETLVERYKKERGRSYAERLPTIRAIAAVRDERAARFLVAVARTRTEHASIRREAASALGQKAYAPYANEVAVLALDSSGPAVAEQALLALHWLGYPDREALYRRQVGSSQSLVVRGASQGLILLGARAEVERLARDSTDAMIRAYAYYALRFDKTPPGLALLRAAARDESPMLRSYALEDMQKLGLPEARTHALLSVGKAAAHVGLGYRVAEVLGRAADPEAVAALFELARATKSAAVRERIRRELAPIRGPALIPVLLKALRSKEPRVRALAATMLATMPDRKTTDALSRQAKREKDGAAIQAMLEALAEHGDPRSIDLLLSIARRKDPGQRAAAIRALARIGPGVRKVREFFLRMLTSSRWQDRVYALDAAGAVGDPEVAPKVIANLPHKVWQVRHAAAQALGKLRVRASVLPMIERLGVEEVKRVRAALAQALFVTTGQNLYDFADTWARWWRDHGDEFKVPAEIPMRRKGDAGTVASFYGLPLDSGRVIFVIDRSGSMSATGADRRSRLQTAVTETISAVGRLKRQDRVNVIFFESAIHPWQQRLVPLTPSNRGAMKSYLEKQRPTGGTNLYDALELALGDKGVDTIFLLSDGVPGSGKFVSTPDILREVGRRNQTRRIAIHCVSVGTDSPLLKQLAAANGGQYVMR